MSRSVNKITLIGNVGSDPEVRDTDSGTRLAKFSLATTERWSGKTGQMEERTDWHRLTAWGKLAEIVEAHVHKGDRLFVEGAVRYSTSTAVDGSTNYWTEINVRELVFLGGTTGRAPAPGNRSGENPPF